MPQTFRSNPRPAAKTLKSQRLSSHERGYDWWWRVNSAAYRKKNPFCARCLEEGRLTLVVLGRTGVVDHKWPVTKGGPMRDPANWWSLCNGHHSGWKAMLEDYAEQTGQIGELIRWCDDPSSRPTLRGDVSCDAAVSAPNRSTS